ncbi:CGNR zinc finger domain-containing protein [Thermopolyspora sp. NPDC052614]|uniref:CGNR zinc finger domain-containing protein n=1 Tax=Thermopolyspora sp. NPDC052614 TaxID=3155682 RepID=UPI00341ABC31
MSDPAELLRDFVNTYDVEDDADELTSAAALAGWLRDHGLIADDDRPADDDLAVAVALREGLRSALRRNHDRAGTPPTGASQVTGPGEPPQVPEMSRVSEPAGVSEGLDALLAAFPLRVALAGAVPSLEPIDGGVRGGLARLAAAVIEAYAAGTWPRLKVCGEDTCQWAFIDSSKNRSRSWCSMKVCGNRTKTRAYRARHKTAGSAERR